MKNLVGLELFHPLGDEERLEFLFGHDVNTLLMSALLFHAGNEETI